MKYEEGEELYYVHGAESLHKARVRLCNERYYIVEYGYRYKLKYAEKGSIAARTQSICEEDSLHRCFYEAQRVLMSRLKKDYRKRVRIAWNLTKDDLN